MSYPTYDEFVTKESWEVRDAYRQATGHDPAISDQYHNAWRRLNERWSHRDILHDIKHEPLEDGGAGGDEDPPPPLPPFEGELHVNGPNFFAGGKLHVRKSITAFALAKRFAEGREKEALAFMDWAVGEGFNEFRVFTQTNWNGTTNGVEPGWTFNELACDRLLMEARARGARVELVAHTYAYDVNRMVDHLRQVDELCLLHENALLEVANEPPRNSIPLSEILQRYRPSTIGWASGLYGPDAPYPAGESINTHTDRKPEWPRCFKDAVEFGQGAGPYVPFSPPFKGPIMLDEPPQVEQTIRDAPPGTDPVDDWKAYGAGCKFFGCGGTMHSNPTLQKCEIPTDGTVLACISAFIEGFEIVPTQRYTGYSHPSDQGSLRRYRRQGEDGKTYEISVRPFEFKEV